MQIAVRISRNHRYFSLCNNRDIKDEFQSIINSSLYEHLIKIPDQILLYMYKKTKNANCVDLKKPFNKNVVKNLRT